MLNQNQRKGQCCSSLSELPLRWKKAQGSPNPNGDLKIIQNQQTISVQLREFYQSVYQNWTLTTIEMKVVACNKLS